MRGIDLVFRGQVGEAIRLARERAGLSAVKLAEATGIHRVAIGNIEKGEREVTLVELVVLARALGATPVQLVYPGVPDRLVEVLPGVEAKAIDAVMWFSGERRRKPWSVEHPDGTEERALDLARKREQLNKNLAALALWLDLDADEAQHDD
jgi:transcriptional regulator with XRE-family HTH domain